MRRSTGMGSQPGVLARLTAHPTGFTTGRRYDATVSTAVFQRSDDRLDGDSMVQTTRRYGCAAYLAKCSAIFACSASP